MTVLSLGETNTTSMPKARGRRARVIETVAASGVFRIERVYGRITHSKHGLVWEVEAALWIDWPDWPEDGETRRLFMCQSDARAVLQRMTSEGLPMPEYTVAQTPDGQFRTGPRIRLRRNGPVMRYVWWKGFTPTLERDEDLPENIK